MLTISQHTLKHGLMPISPHERSGLARTMNSLETMNASKYQRTVNLESQKATENFPFDHREVSLCTKARNNDIS